MHLKPKPVPHHRRNPCSAKKWLVIELAQERCLIMSLSLSLSLSLTLSQESWTLLLWPSLALLLELIHPAPS